MGAFGIYALVVTFVFVIYYVAMICLDLFGTKGEKKENVEVIHTGTPIIDQEAAPAAVPAQIREDGKGGYEIARDGEEPETYSGQDEATSPDKKEEGEAGNAEAQPSAQPAAQPSSLSAEDIANMDDEELATESAQAKAKVEAIKEQLTTVSPEIQGAMYVDDFTDGYAAVLAKARREDEQAKQLS